MMKRSLVLLFILILVSQGFPPLREVTSQASESFEGSGSVLQSRIVTQSALATFIKKKVILSNSQYASDKIEYPVPENSVVFGTFGSTTWSDLYWTTRDHQSPIRDGFALFSNRVFQIRYTPFVNDNYFRINSTYPLMFQNFTVPSSYDDFEIRYVWLVVRVYSGSARLHAEIWNYGMISFGTSTESVTVTGPYDWWIAMKMTSPRTLEAGEVYRLEVVWETGSSIDVKILSSPRDVDDNAKGNARFLNTTSGNVEEIPGKMLEGVLTIPVSNTYSTSFITWPRPLSLQNYRVYLHGRNIPRSSILMKVNSLTFGTGEVSEIVLPSPLDELAFWTPIQGSTIFSGGVIEISSNLISVEQGRTSYDENHPPPFFRPFVSLSIFTDNAGKPWGEWRIGGETWEAYVGDTYLNFYALPVDRVEQRESNQKATYQLLFYPPASPSYGFLNFTVKFNYSVEVSSPGPEFYSSYSVSPLNYAYWNISNLLLSFTAPPHSSVVIKIGPVPRDWIIQRAFVTPGAGGGTPLVSIVNDEITISGILMGASNTYSGRAEISVRADNYFASQAAYLRFKWMDACSSIFLQNDTIRIEARAASAVPSFPPGAISIEVAGPAGALFNQSLGQLDQNGVSMRNISLSQVGQYLVRATYKSLDSLRVGVAEASFKVIKTNVTVNKKTVLLSSPNIIVELTSSDISSISSARFVLTSPNGSTKIVMFDKSSERFVRELSFSQTEPSSIGRWNITPTIFFLSEISRQLPSLNFLVLDDVPPTVSNITQLPREATFMDEVNISCIVTDRGIGVRSVWISYSSGAFRENATAKPMGLGKYSAVIPKQPLFATVSYRVYAADNSGNTSVSETFTYTVGIPIWLLIPVALALVITVLIVWLRMKTHTPPSPPSPMPPPSPEGLAC